MEEKKITGKVIFIQLFGSLDKENRAYVGAQYEEAVSLQYLAASLEHSGHKADVLKSTLTIDELIYEIEKMRPIALGFCVYTGTYHVSLLYARAVKEKARDLGYDLKTIFGGYHCSAIPEEVVRNKEVDFVVVGEGEITICELVEKLKKGEDTSDVKGLIFMEGQGIIRTPPRERIKYLDSIPWPKRYKEYTCQPRKDVANLTYPPFSTPGYLGKFVYARGCPFACSFCSSRNTWGNQIYWRSPKDVVDEIEMMVENYEINYAGFFDLTFNANKKKVLDLCKELIRRKPPVHLGAMVRVDLFDKEMLEALAEAKFVKFAIGLESPLSLISNKVKDSYVAKENHIKDILRICNNLGFIIRAFVIIGFPDETKDILDAYPEALNDYDVDELRLTIATPFPNTQLWDECQKRNLMPEKINWSDYTTEKLVFNHPHLTDQDFHIYREKISTSFYFDKRYIDRISNKIKKHPHLKRSWTDFFENVKERGLFSKYNEPLDKLIDSLKSIEC